MRQERKWDEETPEVITAAFNIASVGTLSVSMLLVLPVEANFVDDWIGATAGGGPMYYQGQQRGYFTGGSYSARWGSSVDPLVNISLPKVKGGCGGIDLFNGGVSFMDFDYLVKKLQNVWPRPPRWLSTWL